MRKGKSYIACQLRKTGSLGSEVIVVELCLCLRLWTQLQLQPKMVLMKTQAESIGENGDKP
jgi:hypothetical protein